MGFHGEGEAKGVVESPRSQGDPPPGAGGTGAAGRRENVLQHGHPRLPLPLAANLCLTREVCRNLHSASGSRCP